MCLEYSPINSKYNEQVIGNFGGKLSFMASEARIDGERFLQKVRYSMDGTD